MRAICGLVAAVLIGFAQPALAECVGDVCVFRSGEVYVWGGNNNREPGIAKYPNASGGTPTSTPPASSGETVVMKPSAQSGNAWVLTPQSSGGATVTTCGSGETCR